MIILCFSDSKASAKIWKRRHSRITIIYNDQGKICTTEEEVQKVWLQDIQTLYADTGRPANWQQYEDLENAPDISMEELELALRTAKNRKAVGSDQIPVEILKKLTRKSKNILLKILNSIYRTCDIPEDFTISIVIPLPKK